MKKKLLALLLVLVMIVGLLPGAAWADTGAWNGTATTEPSKIGDVYQIGTAEELAWFAGHVNATAACADSALLISDIDLNNKNWTPIGTQTNVAEQYKGIFNGQYKTISGLSISNASANQGLLGTINGATIKNVNVSGAINCGTSNNIGGIVGKIQTGTIENCSFSGTVKGGYTGGIAGNINAAGVSITGCSNYGTIIGTYVGGILGYSKNSAAIENCYNTGEITGSDRSGGIIGQLSAGKISFCYNVGAILGTASYKGGICAFNNATTTNCFYKESSTEKPGGSSALGKSLITDSAALLAGLNSNGNNVWAADSKNINDGYPILAWQAKTETVKVPVVSVSVDGTARSGKNLTAQAKGAGEAASTGVKYQWQIADSATGDFSDISGATGQGFALTDAHVGKFLKVSVTGDENSSAVSSTVGPVLISEVKAVAADKASLGGIPFVARSNTALTLPASGTSGSTITWSSNNTDIIKNNGSVTLPETDNATVTLTATISCGGASDTKTFSILVYSQKAVEEESGNASVYLKNAVASLLWYKLNPVYGIDTNVNAVLKAALTKNGYGDLAVSVKSAENPVNKKASIASNGDITYYYADPNTLGSSQVTNIPVIFTLSKGGSTAEYSSNPVIGWNIDEVNTYLNTEIFSSISIPTTAEESFDLPKYLGGKGGKTWVELSYSVSDESALTISSEKQSGSADNFYKPYVGKIKTLPADRTVTLTVTAEFNYSKPSIKMSKSYSVTIKGNPEAAETLRKGLLAKLDAGCAAKGLTDYVTKNKLAETGGVYTAVNDIKLPTTKDFAVDGKDYPVTLKSSDTDVLVTPDVNNAARVYVYRPLPGKSAKTAKLTVTITEKATGISASKEFKISVSPLTQEEIDAEIALMTQTKAHYFDGIKNKNTSAKSITGDLHAFQEAYLKDGTLTWVYDSKELVNHGIVPVAMDGWETLEQWRVFRSSNASVVSHENLRVTPQTESKAVTVTSYLSSEVYGKYAEKYPGNANFRKLYYQPVTASLIVRGTNPTGSEPVAEKLAVSFTLQSADSAWIAKTNVSGLEEGSTVFDVFTQMLAQKGYSFEARGSYVYIITKPDGTRLEELDAGKNSGWLYKVNGVTPSSYMADCPLKNGDNVVVFFTKDYTQDVIWSDSGTSQSGGNVAPAVTAQSGKAEATIDSKSITSAISQNNGKVVIAPRITGSAESVSVSIPATSFKEIAENASGALSIQSDCGSVSIPNGTLDSVSEQAVGTDIKMTMQTKTAKDVNLPAADLENAAIVEISISSGGKNITTFGGGSLGVSIPVTGSYKTADTYKVIVISADGTVETLVGKVVVDNGSSFVEVSVSHLSTFVVTSIQVAVFEDVKSDAWYYDAVQYTTQKSMMKGVGEKSFAPNVEMSRAMLVTVLYRLAGAPSVSGESGFSDVSKGEWYADAVLWASKNGIVNGHGNGIFRTDENVTREEAAVILFRYSEFKKLDISKNTELSAYKDVSAISSWAMKAIRWANASGIITGTSTNTLSPNGCMTRAQAATVLMRLDKYAATASKSEISKFADETAAYILKTVSEPQIGSIGGEWALIGLARSGYSVPQTWLGNYYLAVEKDVTACKGVLSSTKYTEYSRVILALTAIGKAPANVNGYDLLLYLADYNNVVKQGLNGSVWALIALDSGNYSILQNSGAKVQAKREMYIDGILAKQLSGGGFSLTGEEPADIDMTAMALCALSRYQTRADVALAVAKAITYLSGKQETKGGYASCCESTAQVIIALCSLGISENDSRFVKNGCTLTDGLLRYYAGNGQFKHVSGGEANQMATEQALLALTALQRAENGESAIYSVK